MLNFVTIDRLRQVQIVDNIVNLRVDVLKRFWQNRMKSCLCVINIFYCFRLIVLMQSYYILNLFDLLFQFFRFCFFNSILLNYFRSMIFFPFLNLLFAIQTQNLFLKLKFFNFHLLFILQSLLSSHFTHLTFFYQSFSFFYFFNQFLFFRLFCISLSLPLQFLLNDLLLL